MGCVRHPRLVQAAGAAASSLCAGNAEIARGSGSFPDDGGLTCSLEAATQANGGQRGERGERETLVFVTDASTLVPLRAASAMPRDECARTWSYCPPRQLLSPATSRREA